MVSTPLQLHLTCLFQYKLLNLIILLLWRLVGSIIRHKKRELLNTVKLNILAIYSNSGPQVSPSTDSNERQSRRQTVVYKNATLLAPEHQMIDCSRIRKIIHACPK